MAVMVPSTDLIDPLHDHSELSLLPRTFQGFKRNDKLKHHTLQSVMKALAVNSPNNLSEQAKIVLNNSSELQTLDMQSTHKDSPARVNIRPQERRPAMGRKRARFSLRPSTSQSTVVGGMSLNIDKLQDPEEYFLAFEKHERAEKELQKQRGDVPTDLTRHIPTTAARSRRPGISGRRASHGPRFSLLVANLDETIGPSGEVSEVDTPSRSNKTPNVATTDEHGTSQEKKLAGNGFMGATQVDSVAEEENNGGLLNELLSQGDTNLDGDEAVKYIQERLQIKPFNLEKLCLPEVDGVRRSDGKVSLKQLPRQNKALSEVHNAAERVMGTQLAESSNISLDSPTPPRSPYSSRYLSDRVPSGEQFLPPGIEDNSSVRDSTHDESIEKGAPLLHVDSNYEPVEVEVNGNEPSSRFVSMTTEKPPADTSTVLDNTLRADCAHSIDLEDDKVGGMQPDALDKWMNPIDTRIVLDKPGTDDAADLLDPVEGRVDPVETYMDVDKLVTDDSAHLLDPTLENLHKSSQGMDLSSNGLPEGFEDAQTVGSNQAEPSCEGLNIEDLNCPGSPGTSGPTINEDQAKEQSQAIDTLPGETNQESPGESPNALNKQKGSPRGGRKRRLVHRKSPTGELLNIGSKQKSRASRRSSRKSLLGAGTCWQDGQRKSTRIRMRPLEFWRGERFLHGRVHESLLTVIACKYASPGKGDPKPKLKVRSFVPDTYKDLVGKVANDGLPASGL